MTEYGGDGMGLGNCGSSASFGRAVSFSSQGSAHVGQALGAGPVPTARSTTGVTHGSSAEVRAGGVG